LGEDVIFPTSRHQALEVLDNFVATKLDRFGELEDAMYQHNDTVYHSLLSTSINFGLLTPREVIQAVAQSDTAINNKE
jgi:deoxyribodipyrimidine photolyase-related protein